METIEVQELAVQTNNMFSIWRDACIYANSLNTNKLGKYGYQTDQN